MHPHQAKDSFLQPKVLKVLQSFIIWMWIVTFLNHHMRAWKVNSAPPNIVAVPSQITVSLSNKRPAQDVLAILAPQLPPKRIRAER